MREAFNSLFEMLGTQLPVRFSAEIPFNSLFEMRNASATMRLGSLKNAFNSLFEMPVPRLSSNTAQELATFNSLFEMHFVPREWEWYLVEIVFQFSI